LYLKRYSQYASSWIKATCVLGWPSWWVSDSKKWLTLNIYDQWECQDPKVDPKVKPYFADNIPWNLAQTHKPCSYLPLKSTGTWNGHWWNILEPASRHDATTADAAWSSWSAVRQFDFVVS
jgi:hypothetical protein